jgi:hypothetical protein
MDNPPRFLSLPFPADPQMEVFHGWRYTHNRQVQCGIDYGKRDASGRLMQFPVLASADGEACADLDGSHYGGCVSGFGHRVLIKHTIDGQTFYTYYGHLESIASEIPIGSRSNTVRVQRGQIIGIGGDTGTYGGSIHLHYGIASPNFGWYDPYDLWTTAHVYPDPFGLNGHLSGPDYFWLTNPPTVGSAPVGNVEASLPADALTAGMIDLSEWTHILGRESGVVEIWIDGEKRGEAYFGPVPGGGNISSFTWEWDTTRERNGPHQVRLKAFGEDSRVEPKFSVTEAQEASFLITVQNPIGYVNSPLNGALARATIPITGWATVQDSTISEVEIWIDGEKRGSAAYGLSHQQAGGDYGFYWEWDTSNEPDGPRTLIVKAIAANGGSRELPSVRNIEQTHILVDIRNRASVHRWTVR